MKILFLAALLFCSLNGRAQKEDYIWLLGDPPNIPEQNSGGTMIDFHISPLSISFFDIPLDFGGISMISNPAGTLQFYSNGCLVMNAQHELMENGDGINEGLIASFYCNNWGLGYPCGNCVLAMPAPGDSSKYILLHKRADNSTLSKDFLLTRIDMSQNNGLGAVTSKNEIILQDTFSDFLTAVRHGNGRDWWVMLHKNRSNRSLCYLLDPTGLHAPIVQHLGPIWNYQDWAGQSVFSPDGSKYARANPYNGLSVFDFDRCAGTLSNHLFISLAADSASACGVAFSPNSRFLYLSTGIKLFQFDMQAADIAASKQLIGVYDGFASPLPTTFYQMMLAPNGKIYMTTGNGTKYLHVIHQPDKQGAACDFEQRGVTLLTIHSFSPPNFPHFRLFDAHDSPCDTLGINGPPPPEDTTPPPPRCAGNIRIYPNPAQHLAQIELPDCEGGSLRVFDAMGRWVEDLALAPESVGTELDVSRYVPGIYFLHIRTATGEAVVRGLAVVR